MVGDFEICVMCDKVNWRYKMGKSNIVLQDRDIKIFELINKFGWLREDYLAKYLGLDWENSKVKNTMAVLAYRLSKYGYIVKQKIIAGFPAYWALGKNGADFISGVAEKKIVLMTLRHNDIVADLAIDLLVRGKVSELLTEAELKRNIFGDAAKKKKLPDLVIDGKIAIEVEISKKPDVRLSTILANYASSHYEQIIYYTNSKGIADRINKLSNSNVRFNYRLFKGIDILNYEDYKPGHDVIVGVPARNEHGQYESSHEKRLKDLGFT